MWSCGTRSSTNDCDSPAATVNVAVTPPPARRSRRSEPIVFAIAPSSASVSDGARNSTPWGCISTSCSSRA